MSHWAAAYPGRPYCAGADGPDAFDCWGLVRAVFRAHFGVEFPPVAVGGPERPENVRAIKHSARVSGMRPVDGARPADGDIVLMRSIHQLHCGVVVELAGRAHVLHAAHEAGVVCEPWPTATLGMSAELWRRAA